MNRQGVCSNCQLKPIKAKRLCAACYERERYAADPQLRPLAREAQARYRKRSWAKRAEGMKKWRAAHPEHVAAYTKAWRHKNSSRVRQKRLAHYRDNRRKEIDYARDWNFKKKYGISLDERDQLIKEQSNCCAACGEKFVGTTGKLCPTVHHDHGRTDAHCIAILHGRCNVAMGQVGDNPELLEKIAAFARKHSGTTVPLKAVS
jgi:hypothetical protein